MGRKKAKDGERLSWKLFTRVNERKYNELKALCERTGHNDMSELLRDILYHRPVKTITRDMTLANVMEELARLRTEIMRIGVNINQITKVFNSYPERERKAFYAKLAFAQYSGIEAKIDSLLEIVGKLAKRWLQG
jgi:hypothetical protein